MGQITVSSGSYSATLQYSAPDAVALAQSIADAINGNAGLAAYAYTAGLGTVAPGPASGNDGVVFFAAPSPPSAVLVPSTDGYVVQSGESALSIQGGVTGGSILAEHDLTLTQITPAGTAVDTVAVLGGNNLIQTVVDANGRAVGSGSYLVATGNGSDTINILSGNATINPGTGYNQVNLGGGNSLIASEGYDTITGASVGGGTDTVDIGSGQTSINTGTSSFLIRDASPNPLAVTLGTGTDTVEFTGAYSAMSTLTGASGSVTHTGLGLIFAQEANGADTFTFNSGHGVGADTVSGLASYDTLVFSGLANTAVTGSSTIYTLNDGTTISVLGSPTGLNVKTS